jgi:hypothetical protein
MEFGAAVRSRDSRPRTCCGRIAHEHCHGLKEHFILERIVEEEKIAEEKAITKEIPIAQVASHPRVRAQLEKRGLMERAKPDHRAESARTGAIPSQVQG